MLLIKKYLLLIIFSLGLIISCDNDDVSDIPKDKLELIATYNIDVLEPSGLAINNSGNTLYTVSDNTAQVFKLSTKGEVIKTFNYVGQDLEGVSTFKDNKLLLAEERTKEIVEFDMQTGIYSKHEIDYDNNSSNSGMEGITYNINDNSIYILNEKDPGKLIKLRSDYTVMAEYDLNFASDYSGIYYENSTNNLWIISDQYSTLNKCTLTGDLIESYPIRITQPEGIAIANEKVYIISDAEEKLYIYNKPQN